jgi:hypothetical protein
MPLATALRYRYLCATASKFGRRLILISSNKHLLANSCFTSGRKSLLIHTTCDANSIKESCICILSFPAVALTLTLAGKFYFKYLLSHKSYANLYVELYYCIWLYQMSKIRPESFVTDFSVETKLHQK